MVLFGRGGDKHHFQYLQGEVKTIFNTFGRDQSIQALEQSTISILQTIRSSDLQCIETSEYSDLGFG